MILAILELFRRMDNETIEAFIREHKDELRDEKILSVCGGAGSVREDAGRENRMEDELLSLFMKECDD